jgi:hypothetical protein
MPFGAREIMRPGFPPVAMVGFFDVLLRLSWAG